jgi:carboxypeptidase family protein
VATGDVVAEVIVTLDPAVSLDVVVTDAATGRALSGTAAILLKSRDNPATYSAVVNNGHARFQDLPPVPAIVTVKSEGMAPRAIPVQLHATPPSNSVEVPLKPASSISGTVIDSHGDPVEGAIVSISYASAEHTPLAALVGGRIITRSDGRFTITGVSSEARVRLQARLGALASDTLLLSVAEGESLGSVIVRMSVR